MKQPYKETDMYLPIKAFFMDMGYTVYAEVKDCDVALIKDDRLAIIELKTSFNLKLIFQAVDRLKITDEVYVAIPRIKKHKSSRYYDILSLVKRLGIGLIMVTMDSPLRQVEIIVLPNNIDNKSFKKNAKRKSSVINELSSRTFDLNTGGSTKKKIATAYREKAIKIACILEAKGALKASELIKQYSCDENTYSMLYSNPYGWFERAGNGRFGLSEKGINVLYENEFIEIINYYKDNLADV